MIRIHLTQCLSYGVHDRDGNHSHFRQLQGMCFKSMEWHWSTPKNHTLSMVCQKNAWPKDCQHTHTRQLMCVRGMNNRKHRASAVKAVHGLLQSDFLQVKETNTVGKGREGSSPTTRSRHLVCCHHPLCMTTAAPSQVSRAGLQALES